MADTGQQKAIVEREPANGDTSSPEVQIALLTPWINGLAVHLKRDSKSDEPDASTRRRG